MAIQRKDYYGLLLISVSIPDDLEGNNLKRTAIKNLSVRLGKDSFLNAMIGYNIKTLISKSYLIEDNEIQRDRLREISEFVRSLRKNQHSHQTLMQLKNIDAKILQKCVDELAR